MKPNILLLQCHDLGNHLACYPGNSACTPNLDWLATEGTVFEQHFAASPVCNTSQEAMLSGLVPHRNRLVTHDSNDHRKVNPEVRFLPYLLQSVDYNTAFFGSWRGDDEFLNYGIEQGDKDSRCDRIATKVTRYLQSHLREQPKKKPFFLMVNFELPYYAFTDPWSDVQRQEEMILPGHLEDKPEVRAEMAQFYSGISHMDAAVGQVLDALWECGFDESTLVIFTSDCGISMPIAKGTLYDPGIKIPLIICWYKRLPSDQRCDALTSSMDLLPTIMEAIGEPERIPKDLDGHSLWPFINRGEDVGHDYIFAEWYSFYGPIRAIRTTQYKLIRNFEPGVGLQIIADMLHMPARDAMWELLCNWPRPEIELYDLLQDPWERNNLAGHLGAVEIKRVLISELYEWLSCTDDPILNRYAWSVDQGRW